MAGRFNLAEHIQTAQPPASRDIEVITGEILSAKQQAGESILTIGRDLMEAKSLLSHGEWLPWLEERVAFSEATAQRYMQLARRFPNPATLRDLGYSKALTLLALPEKTMDEFIEAPHVVDGEEKAVNEMSVRELKAAIKARDEALKAAEQAKADKKAAEEAREQISTKMALANNRLKELNAQVWIWNAIHTERYRNEIYSLAYGSEFHSLLGQAYTEGLKTAEAHRYLRECLLVNPYITAVNNITVEFAGDRLTVSGTAVTVYGEVSVNAAL